jgi:hypothetical protein
MTIRPSSSPILHQAPHGPAASDARPLAPAAPGFLRHGHADVRNALASSSQATLLHAFKGVALPPHFSPGQTQIVRNMLDKYHPQTLSRSPVVDAKGIPMPLRLSSTPLTDPVTGEAIEVKTELQKSLVNMVANHGGQTRWMGENIGVRKIGPGEAEPALVGQEGVFAKKAIPVGTPVGIFGGMYLDQPEDINLDRKIRSMAGLDPLKYVDPQVSKSGAVLQGMGPLMKCNSTTDGTSNLHPVQLNVLTPTGEKLSLMALFTKQPVEAGQELRFNYKL